MVNDPISDLLIRIMNAQKVGHQIVKIPYSRMKFDLAKILEQEKFIEDVRKDGKEPKQYILINLKYEEGLPVIRSMKRISKPGQRIYIKKNEFKPVKKGYGIIIISTSSGLMTDKEAKKRKIGGEILCEVW